MPWAAGTFTRTNGVHTGSTAWQDDKAAGTPILASRHDVHDADLTTGINACVTKDGANATNVVATAWVQDGAITEAKLADDAASRSAMLFEGRDTNTGNTANNLVSRSGAGSGVLMGMPKAGKVTHLVITKLEAGSSISAGSIVFTLFKSGVTTSQTVTWDSATNPVVAIITPVTFVASDYLHFQSSTTSLAYGGGGLAGAHVAAWGHFTA